MKPKKRNDKPPLDDLQRRAASFAGRPIPVELQPRYVEGSIADIVIASYAQGEAIDPELLEIAELAAQEYDGAIAQAQTQELKDYFKECQSILGAIIAKSTS